MHIRDLPFDETVDVKQIAKHAEGFVGADLEAVATEAAMHLFGDHSRRSTWTPTSYLSRS